MRLADPWQGMNPDKLPSKEPHPDFPDEYLNYYRTKIGVYIPVPAAFPPEKPAP